MNRCISRRNTLKCFSRKWIEIVFGTTFACMGFSFIGEAQAETVSTTSTNSPQKMPSESLSLNPTRTLLQTLLEEMRSEKGQHSLNFLCEHGITPAVLMKLYTQGNFQPLWFTPDAQLTCAEEVINTLEHADEEGLENNDYRLILDKIHQYLHPLDGTPSLENLLMADILLSRVLLEYINDINGERLCPKKIDKELYLERPKIDLPEFLISLIKESPYGDCSWIKKLSPESPQYQALKGMLKNLKERKAQGKSDVVLSPGGVLKKGSSGKRVCELREVLATRGYGTLQNQECSIFDETLEHAVMDFQKDSGLEVDGNVGEEGQRVLSQRLDDKIDQVIVTMERWRWLPRNLGLKYVFVNIPDFQVRTYENENHVFTMPVIIGRTYRETPVLAAEIINVIYNPTWTVPPLIASQDKLKDVQKKGPQYFIDKKIHVYKDGREIDPRKVNWTHVTKENFNFHLRQDSGDQNALGRIRFTILSPFDVYLHGTPEQELFSKVKRTLSSGCVRLENPVKMAEFVFGGNSSWDGTTIKAAIDSGKTQTIPLQNPVKVYIQYMTVFLEDNGKVRFLEDVYGQDKEVLNALKKRNPQAP